jgi:hypothetical protein
MTVDREWERGVLDCKDGERGSRAFRIAVRDHAHDGVQKVAVAGRRVRECLGAKKGEQASGLGVVRRLRLHERRGRLRLAAGDVHGAIRAVKLGGAQEPCSARGVLSVLASHGRNFHEEPGG